MESPFEVAELLKRKKFDEVDTLWTRRIESAPDDLGFFSVVARDVARAGEKERAATLLGLAAEAHRERENWPAVLTLLKAAAAYAADDEELRAELLAVLGRLFPARRNFAALAARSGLAGKAPAGDAAQKLERWLPYDQGEFFLLKGKGLVRVLELNPDLEKVRLALPVKGEISFKLDEARQVLTPLGHDHFLVRKAVEPDELRRLAREDAPRLVEMLFASFQRALTGKELREHLSGVVPEAEWSRWWGRVKGEPRLIASGSGARLSYHWSASADHAEERIREEIAAAPPGARIELARRHAGRSEALDRELAASLARAAMERATPPALALEALLFLEDLFPGATLADSSGTPRQEVERLLHQHDPGELVVELGDAGLQETALEIIQKLHPGTWVGVFTSVFRRSGEPRTLERVYEELASSESPDVAVSLVDAVFASPRRYPRQFLWVFQEALKDDALRHRLDAGAVRKVLESYRQEEFKPFRARILALLDQPGFLESPLERATETEARHLLTIIDGDCGLTGQRREALRSTLTGRFPGLAKKEITILVTPESLARKRAEYRRLTEIDMPRNSADIGRAAALGDLSENSEYKSAREKQLLLMSQVRALDDELTRAREIDPASVPTDRVGVGSRVTLRRLDGGEPMVVTILGPWDSDPDRHVISYLTPLGEDFLDKRPGDRLHIWGHDYEVAGLVPWTEPHG